VKRLHQRGNRGRAIPKGGKVVQSSQGCGFIQPQGGDKDVCVGISAVEQTGFATLNEGKLSNTKKYEQGQTILKFIVDLYLEPRQPTTLT
jgi:cold shock CspA family protein